MEMLIGGTYHALDMLYQSVRRMPEDKLVWRPLDMGRSVMDQLQECAGMPDWLLPHLDPDHKPAHSSYEEAQEARKSLDTVDKCYDATKASTDVFVAAVRKLTPEQLAEKRQMPWGQEHTVAEICTFHSWNLTYHLGQVNYIQTLYGDNEMM